MGHTIYRGTQKERDLWDTNPICQCQHTWRSHWLKSAGGVCGVTSCGCERFVAAADDRG